MSINHDIKYVNAALQSYSESPLVVAAWKNIRAALAELGTSPNKPSSAIKTCPTCLEYGAGCEHPVLNRLGCHKWVGTF